uniref:Uncharacterized protein n=1 Tax=Trichobilharzia regenti TaxID=157069 RepID=A0AA85K777_TRIRE|nr:unnamed protein product [Trichobilharzia regenti]
MMKLALFYLVACVFCHLQIVSCNRRRPDTSVKEHGSVPKGFGDSRASDPSVKEHGSVPKGFGDSRDITDELMNDFFYYPDKSVKNPGFTFSTKEWGEFNVITEFLKANDELQPFYD